MLPIDWELHYYDLEQPENGWTKRYDYKEMYGLEDISPASMLNLAEKVAIDSSLAQKVAMLFDQRHNAPQFGKAQQKEFSCEAANAVYFDQLKCMGDEFYPINAKNKYYSDEMKSNGWYTIDEKAMAFKTYGAPVTSR